MAVTIHQFTVTIPANTQIASPFSYAVDIPVEQVQSIDLEVPPGPSGLMGFYLAMSGVQIIPFEAGEWIIWDNYRDSWALQDYPESNAWSVVGYNLDEANDHEVVLRFHDVPLSASSPAAPTFTIVYSGESQLITL